MSSRPGPMSSLILLWAGEDPGGLRGALERLDAAGIPCKNMAIGEDETAPSADPLPVDWKARFGFEVAVLSADLTAAQQILEKVLAEDPQDLEIPEQPVATKEPPLTDATEAHPTVEVWTGTDEKMAEFLTAALQENEIPIHLENPADQTHIYVSAANEARAREIVREITEGAPPN